MCTFILFLGFPVSPFAHLCLISRGNMAFVRENLHKLARLNYFKHTPDVVVVGGIHARFPFTHIGNGFVGRYVCRIAAQCGFIPVSISVDPTPPVYGEDAKHLSSWVTRVSPFLLLWRLDAMARRRCDQTIDMGSARGGGRMYSRIDGRSLH